MKRVGLFLAIMFILSAAVYAQSYTITVTFNEYGTWETGILEFTPLGIRTQCWFDGSTSLRRGSTYEASATYMSSKTDSVTGGPRPAIFLKIPGSQIFIHEGTSPAWSRGCIVIQRDVMLRIWKYLYSEAEPYNIRVVIK